MTTRADRRLFVISGLLAPDLLLTRLSLAADVECPVRVGEYSGTVKAEWLTKTREMRLLEDFAFKGPDCRVWAVPKGAVVDGASIPRVFWSVIGGPFEGRYRDASVVHDYYCKIKTAPSAEVHEMFYHAMLANGVETHIAGTMFYAVHWFGPSWHILKGVSKTATGPALFETVSADVKLTHCAGVKVTHLGDDGGFLAVDVDPGASSGDTCDGPQGRRNQGDREAAWLLAQYRAAVLA